MKKPRIGVIGLKGLPAHGGAASVGENIITRLGDRFDFTVYATKSHTVSKKPFENVCQVIIPSLSVPSLNIVFYYIASALDCVFRKKFDVIHLHHIDAAFILFLLRIRYRVISTSHGLTYKHSKWSKGTHWYFRLNEWIQCRLSSHITVVSKLLFKHYLESQNVEIGRLSYIPNGVNTSILLDYEEKYFDVVFSAARIIPSKGLHLLTEALADLNHIKVQVIGKLDVIPSYEKFIRNSASNLDVQFVGLIKTKSLLFEWLRRAKILVFPSSYEAMSMMLLEAASLKVPVICSDIDANRELFSDNEVLFYSASNTNDLRKKILWALSNYESMTEKAEKAYVRVKEEFEWTGIVEMYSGIYSNIILNEKGNRGR